MVLPATVPGVRDAHAARLLGVRWGRARGYLLTALLVCPVGIVVLCASVFPVVAAAGGFTWWQVLPVVGAALPAVVVLGRVPAMTYEPPRWVRASTLCGGTQLLLGTFPALGLAVSSGGLAATAATVVFVLSLVMVILGVFSAARASRALLNPVTPELGATPFTVAFRPRLHDTGLVSGSVSVGRDGVEWAARRHRSTGHGSLPFHRIRAVHETAVGDTAGPAPWLPLSDGSTVDTTPGPAVTLDTDAGSVLLPLDQSRLFLDLLGVRIAAWRGGNLR